MQREKTRKIFLWITIIASGLLMVNWSTNDLYFMFSHGKYILEQGFPTVEPFTLHEGFSFSIQKWASCVTYWLLYSNTGWAGLVVLTAVLAMIRNAIFYFVIKPIAKNDGLCALLVLVYAALMQDFTLTRPQQFSDVILLLEILFLEKYSNSGKRNYLYPLPFLSLLEMQFHSTTWLIFFIVLIPYVAEHEFQFQLPGIYTTGAYRKCPILLAGISSVLAGLINPYGIRTFSYIINEFRGNDAANALINELQPLIPSQNWKTMLLILGCIVLWRVTRLRQRYAMFFLGTGFMAFTHLRSLETFIPFLTICLADMLSQLDLLEKIARSKTIRMLMYAALAVICGAFSLFVVVSDTTSGRYANDSSGIRAVDWLVDTYGIDGDAVVFTTFNCGAYAEYRGIKGYIDSRSEVFQISINQKEDIMEEYQKFQNGTIYYTEMQEKYGFDYWFVESTLLQAIMTADPDYELIYSDLYGYTIYRYVGGETRK